MFDNNFGQCGPILKFCYQLIPNKILHVYITKIYTSPAVCCCTTLWNSKIQKGYWFWQHLQQNVHMFLRTLWGPDLTRNSSLTYCLKYGYWNCDYVCTSNRPIGTIRSVCHIQRLQRVFLIAVCQLRKRKTEITNVNKNNFYSTKLFKLPYTDGKNGAHNRQQWHTILKTLHIICGFSAHNSTIPSLKTADID